MFQNNQTALHLAIESDPHSPLLLSLIEKCTNINDQDYYGNTPLHLAALERCGFEIVRSLITKGANLSAQNIRGTIPLGIFLSVQNDHETILYVIDHTPDVNIQDKQGFTPLHSALQNSYNREAVLYLIEKTSYVDLQNNYRQTPLHMAVGRGLLEVVRALVAKGANLRIRDKHGKYPIHYGNTQGIVLYLIGKKADINSQDFNGATLLHSAISNRSELKFIRFLVIWGANLNVQTNEGFLPLHDALRFKYKVETISYLAENTDDVNTRNKLGDTPLHLAIKKRHRLEIIRCLVAKGANVDSEDALRRTSLHLAIEYNTKKLLLFLIGYSADINSRCHRGRTPLHCVLLKNYGPKYLKALVEKGADFNVQDIRGITPFHLITKPNRLPLLSEAFSEEVNNLKNIRLSQQTTLYDALVLQRHDDWISVDRPMECLSEENEPFWTVILSSILANRTVLIRLHARGVTLDEDSTLSVTHFLECYDIINLHLAFWPLVLKKKRSGDFALPVGARRVTL